MTPAQIREAVRSGEIVVVNDAFHTAHVVEDEGLLVSKSDEGIPKIKWNENGRYTTFIFRKRAQRS